MRESDQQFNPRFVKSQWRAPIFCTRGYESKDWLKSASLCYFSSGAFRWNVGRSLRCGQLANSRAAIAG